MFTSEQYRAKAIEYSESLKTSTDPHERRVYQELRRHFAELADNEQRLSDNHQRTLSAPAKNRSDDLSLAEKDEHMLRCLGAALIMQWNTLPAKLQMSCSIMLARWASCRMLRLSGDKSLAFCTE